ncbi:hypothetical protein DICVIV_12824 [Dictyocaulus viviparus]|uniref:Uncharacterized protein n=1 Tax=Dictyocaulus viviparus TaxID=29172 RepID=A0A0D8X9E7_DICVI|nr:hypothetical protein DICVIV_12824 [Dictyocaulus viviparus]
MIDLKRKAANAMIRFVQTRPPPSAESARRVKEELRHTIFEFKIGNKSHSSAVMKEMRRQHQGRIRQVNEQEMLWKNTLLNKQKYKGKDENPTDEKAHEAEIDDFFLKSEDIDSVQFNGFQNRKRSNKIGKAEERRKEKTLHFISYSSEEHVREKHLALEKLDFSRQADSSTIELFADNEKEMFKQNNMKRWQSLF